MRLRSVALAVVLAAPAASAQGVRVQLVDEHANAPIAGALLSLKRAGRTMVERVSAGDGSRLLTVPPDTGYVVEVRRVGYQPFASPRFDVRMADTQALVLKVPAIRAVVPPPTRPATRPVECRAATTGPAGRARAGELWHQMRTALASAEIVRAEALEPLAISRYERVLSRTGDQLSEAPANGSAFGNRPFRSAPAAELSRAGFLAPDSTGTAVFRAPDAGVLVSDEFAADYCFDVVSGSGSTSGLIGLAFAPSRDRKVTDIQGVVWADSESLHLRFAEFTYRFPSPSAAHTAGGRILFEQLASSNWIAREWSVRTPVLTQSGQLLGFREEGGEAMVVTTRMKFVMDSVANSRKVPGIITGVVTDSLARQGFAGARVWLDESGPEVRTDAKGVFFMRGVPPGEHLIRFSHPMLDSIEVRPPGRMVKVVSESMVDANLAGPSLQTLVGKACGDTLAVMTGVVRNALTGKGVDSALVAMSWIELKLGPDNRPVLIVPRETVASTDADGRYGACVLAGSEITLYAMRGAGRTSRVDAMTETRRLGIMDLSLDVGAPDTVTGSAEVRGVVKYQDGTPLRNAIVTLSDPELSASTDTAGRFRFASIPGGTRAFDARSIGHAPQRVIVDAKPGAITEASIYMRKVTMLDPIIVRAAADDRTAETLASLAERQRRRQGTRVTGNQLRAFGDARLDVVIRSLQFARLRVTPSVTLMLRDTQGKECRPTVWLDGRRSDISIVVGLRANDVMSLEVMRMRGEVPPEYQDFADCGAVLVWMNPGR
jgi:hypothetical protein